MEYVIGGTALLIISYCSLWLARRKYISLRETNEFSAWSLAILLFIFFFILISGLFVITFFLFFGVHG